MTEAPRCFSARVAHEHQYVGQALLGIEQDALALGIVAGPGRLAELRRRHVVELLAQLVLVEAASQVALRQPRDGDLDARALVLRAERQRPGQTGQRLVGAAEVAQAEAEIEEALGVVGLQRHRLQVMAHRLAGAARDTQRVAKIAVQRRIVWV